MRDAQSARQSPSGLPQSPARGMTCLSGLAGMPCPTLAFQQRVHPTLTCHIQHYQPCKQRVMLLLSMITKQLFENAGPNTMCVLRCEELS